MNIILFDDDVRNKLLPLTYTRPVGKMRIGILTIQEKWEKWLNGKASFITQDYLIEKFPIEISDQNYLINASVLPSTPLCTLIEQLDENEALLKDDEMIAARLNERQFDKLMNDEEIEELTGIDLEDTPFLRIQNTCDIFRLNDAALRSDFELLTRGRVSQPISSTNQIIGKENIFLEEGAKAECAILNASTGPIYIGKDAEIMEGAMIRGPFALCERSIVKMGAKIYGATTVGPVCKVGGEVKNTVLFSYSNKGHDGFLGNSVLGAWCNIGADSNSSNLKNNYKEVRVWNYEEERFLPTGLQFCGLIMGDHSKCGINTMFNTGTVIGVSANIFGEGFPRNFIPSFSWGGNKGYDTYTLEKAFDTIEKVVTRRDFEFGVKDRLILLRIYEDTAKYRVWEKSH
ncbi:MAG: glucose-1-phosphate thymidylyltransferase [Bacteroidetes bacterium]|nr:glucose-1-phosphate thymidylyltransferase [Bacteroidota bacterium]